jgi:Fructose-2,6-bisphosphatase
MITTIYLIRHSEPFNEYLKNNNSITNFLSSNKKMPLSVNGEKLAESISSNNEFSKLDVVFSSDYIRAISTAKYFILQKNLPFYIDKIFGERIHGCQTSLNELPANFGKIQFKDKTFKFGNGESQEEVRNRMYCGIQNILNNYRGKNIGIATHSAATFFLLFKWCNFEYDETLKITFKNKIIFDKDLKYCQTFKLLFDDEKLIDICDINLK